LGTTAEVDHYVRCDLQASDLLAYSLEPGLDPAPLGPELYKGAVQQVHPPPPLFALLHVEQNGLGVDHAGSQEPGARINLSLDVPDRFRGSGARG
jgi:hypothetical protein